MPEFDLFGFLLLAFWAYCIFDVIRTPDGNTENLPKIIWLLIVIFLNFVGGLAWLLLGRPRHSDHPSRFDIRSAIRRDAPPPVAPAAPAAAPPIRDDDYQRKRDEAIRRYNAEREQELKRHEEEMERRARELRQREQGTSESS